MSQMNKVTQQNAANSEQSSSAAQELASQSEELASMVSAFKSQDESRAPAEVRRPRSGMTAALPVIPSEGRSRRIRPSA